VYVGSDDANLYALGAKDGKFRLHFQSRSGSVLAGGPSTALFISAVSTAISLRLTGKRATGLLNTT